MTIRYERIRYSTLDIEVGYNIEPTTTDPPFPWPDSVEIVEVFLNNTNIIDILHDDTLAELSNKVLTQLKDRDHP